MLCFCIYASAKANTKYYDCRWLLANRWFDLDTFPAWANYNEELAGNATSFLINVLSDNQTVAILTTN